MSRRTPTTSRRRRLPGLEVRPGSIKQARAEAGMTLAEIAAGRLSRTAVHLAETGKTRPTLPTLELIAARTGKPVEYFLAPAEPNSDVTRTLRLDKLRELAAAERFEELKTFAEQERSKVQGSLESAWVGFYLAQAQIRLANPRPALFEVRDARRAFEATGDQWMAVECLDQESAALHLLEDASAIEVAGAALAACRKLQPANPALEARILGRLGAIHVANDEWSKAIDSYKLAIEVAGELKDLSRLGKMYSDLSIAYERLGDLPRASAYSQKAINIHELLQDKRSVARAENNLGMVLIRQGDLEEAREHLNRSLSICDETGMELGKSHVLLSLAELALNGGDPEGARRHLDEARDMSEKAGDRGSLALAYQLLGQVDEATGTSAGADRNFKVAISILEHAQLRPRLVGCLDEYARILEARGDTAGALEMTKRALALSRPDLGRSAALLSTETA